VSDVFLRPGEVHVGREPDRVRTLLGSCVSITLWAPASHAGAMCHFLLARRDRRPAEALDGRYGDEALELMLRGLARFGVMPGDCEAKVFGGGRMFPDRVASEPMQVGRRNGEAARRLLEAHGIPLRSHSLFGVGHRRLLFDLGSGHVWASQVRPMDPVS
jgi:chemotaxis protein CheD